MNHAAYTEFRQGFFQRTLQSLQVLETTPPPVPLEIYHQTLNIDKLEHNIYQLMAIARGVAIDEGINVMMELRFHMGLRECSINVMQGAIDDLKAYYLDGSENGGFILKERRGVVVHDKNEESFRFVSEEVKEKVDAWEEHLDIVKRKIVEIKKMLEPDKKKPARRGGKKHRKTN